VHKGSEIATDFSIYSCKSLLDIVIFIGQGNQGLSRFYTEKKSALVIALKLNSSFPPPK